VRFAVDRLDHITLNCRDIDITAAWYQRVLGMEREEFGRQQRSCLKFGGQKLNLRPVSANERDWSSARAPLAGAADLCFVTAVGPDDVVEHLRACGIAVETGPVERIGALGPMHSVYCRDPDGNLIEIATYLDG
jgi:catechol 2,3-dioxygenase-like lactoylglutathione lyase family enzyme